MKKNIWLFLICAAGFCLRLCNLDKADLWQDEICTAVRTSKPLIDMLKHVEWTPYPPLYYLTVNLWTKVFGTSVLALRFPSLIFSSLMIFLIFKLAREMYDDRVAFFSAILLAVSPYSINYAQEAKMYSLLWLWGILSFLYLYRFIKHAGMWNLAAYVASTLGAIYTMYAGFSFIIIHNIFFFSVLKKEKIKPWLAGQLVICLLYLPWVPCLFYHILHWEKYLSWICKTSGYQWNIIATFKLFSGIFFGKNLWINQLNLCIYAALIISAVITWRNIKAGRGILDFKKEEAMLLFWIGVPFFILYLLDFCWIASISNVRKYIGFVHIPLIILLSKGINKYDYRFFRVRLKFIIFFILLSSLVFNQLYPYYQQGFKVSKDDLMERFKWLDKNAGKDSLIIKVNMPFIVMEYFDPENKIKPEGYLKEKASGYYESVFILFYDCAKEKKYRLVEETTRELRLYVFDKFPPFETIDNATVVWLKKDRRVNSIPPPVSSLK